MIFMLEINAVYTVKVSTQVSLCLSFSSIKYFKTDEEAHSAGSVLVKNNTKQNTVLTKVRYINAGLSN
jgi:hypothetical protein